MTNRWVSNGNVKNFIFLGSKITADGDCSPEIKRHLLLGRKAMTNVHSILKSKDITLPTKVCLVKEAEHQRIDAFELWCWRKTLESPLDCKEIKPVNLKESQS